MLAGIVIIAAQAIMHGSAGVVGQDPNGVHRLLSPFAMPGIQSQPLSAIDMDPMQQSFDACAGFIHMVQGASKQQPFEGLHRRGEPPGSFGNPVGQASLGDPAQLQVRKQFTDALQGQQLKLRQIDGQCLHSGPILGWRIHPCRKAGRRPVLTRRTVDGEHLVFCHLQAQIG